MINRELNCFFQCTYRPPSLIEAFSSPEKGWLGCVGLLADNLFNIGAFFVTTTSRCQQKEQQVWRMYCRLATAGPIPWLRTNARRQAWRGASPGPSPAKCSKLKSPAGSGPANVAAIPPGSRILPCCQSNCPGWSWRCGLASNPVRRWSCHPDVFWATLWGNLELQSVSLYTGTGLVPGNLSVRCWAWLCIRQGSFPGKETFTMLSVLFRRVLTLFHNCSSSVIMLYTHLVH